MSAYGHYDFITNIELGKLMFHIFNEDNTNSCFNYGDQLDTLDFIDAYMKSDVRKKMDEGDYIALDYGSKQVYNRIDKTNCKPKTMTYDWISYIGWQKYIVPCSGRIASIPKILTVFCLLGTYMQNMKQ